MHTSSSPPSAVARRTRLVVFCAVFVASAIFLWMNRRDMPTGDSLPYRYLPEAIVEHGTFRLDAFPFLNAPGNYTIVRDNAGHLISKKPVMPAIAEIPIYLGWKWVHGGFENEYDRIRMGKWTMSAVAALTAGVLALLLLDFVPPWLAAAAGFGLVSLTPFWFTAMDCWPHPLVALCFCAALFLCGRRNPWVWLAVGGLLGVADAARPSAFTVSLLIAGAAWVFPAPDRRIRWIRTAAFLLGIASPLILLGVYNAHYFGSPFETGFRAQSASRIRWPFEGLAGLLLSPAKGIFLFSPVLLLLLFPKRSLWKDFRARLAAVAICVYLVFWAMYSDWWGGWAFGPRYLADILPFGIFLAAVCFYGWYQDSRSRRRVVLVASVLAALSLGIQLTGLFTWDGAYHHRFDKGWGKGKFWVWSSPYEPLWRLETRLWPNSPRDESASSPGRNGTE